MAAMDVARSLSSSLLPTPPASATSESFRAKTATPEPHYKLSRLNTPSNTANLRPPSLISRSVSAGMTFSFKGQKDKDKDRDSEKHTQMQGTPSSDERAPSRFGFTLRKKSSLASLMSTSTTRPDDATISRSSSGTGHSSLVVTPIEEQPTPMPPTGEGYFDLSDNEDAGPSTRFVKQDSWRTRHRMKVHPYGDVPYMQAYDPVVLQNDRYSHQLLRRLLPQNSPTFHDYGNHYPASALDLGCGAGLWLLDAARMWRTTQFVGFDLVDIALPVLTDGTLPNVRLVRGDFLNYALPFAKDQFELIRMVNLSLCVPYKKWESLLREAHRVLAPGGRLEIVDDQTIFPYGEAPTEDTIERMVETPNASLETPTTQGLTPRAPPRTPEASAFFDSDDEGASDSSEERVYKTDSSDDDIALASTSDSASERSSFTDTASTLVGEPSERGSVDFKKVPDINPPQLEFEPVHHRPFSGVEHLIISIPPSEPPATIDLTVEDDEGEAPLTPVPPTRAGVPSSPAPIAPPSASDSESAPSTPSMIATELAEDDDCVSGPWSTKANAARDLERVFSRMLATQYGMHTRPGDIIPATLERIFAEGRSGRVEPSSSFHLKLAPPGAEKRPGVTLQGVSEKRARSGVEKERAAKKETLRAADTAIPHGLSAKAAERLGIVGPGAGAPQLRRQPAIIGMLEESDEEDLEDDGFGEEGSEELTDSEESTPSRPSELGTSTWVAPSEWDGPPAALGLSPSPVPPRLTRMNSASSLPTSSSSKTITTAPSSRTITAASSSKTVKQLGLGVHSQTLPTPSISPSPSSKLTPLSHVRGGSTASTESAASALSTASASSAWSGAWSESGQGPQRFAVQRVQHTGLILWPATYIPVPPQELEMHATKHMHTLLGCKPALAEFVATFVDPATGERMVSKEEFEDALWEYECFRRPRLNWPQLHEARMEGDEVSADLPTPASARAAHLPTPRTPTIEAENTNPYGAPFDRFELTHVRSFRVFSAIKGAAPAAAVSTAL